MWREPEPWARIRSPMSVGAFGLRTRNRRAMGPGLVLVMVGLSLICSRGLEAASPGKVTGWGSRPKVLAITSDNRIVTLRLTGIPGQVYQLEASTDLLNWVKLDQTTTGSDGLLVFTDHAQNLYPRRYYRAAQ